MSKLASNLAKNTIIHSVLFKGDAVWSEDEARTLGVIGRVGNEYVFSPSSMFYNYSNISGRALRQIAQALTNLEKERRISGEHNG